MQIEVFHESECFAELQPEWHELLQHSVTNHVFMTPEFMHSWWSILGEGELQVCTFRNDEGKLVGIAPLFLFINDDQQKQLSLIGCVNVSDYLDVVVHREHQTEVYNTLKEALTDHIPDWEVVCLWSIPEKSPTRESLKGFKLPLTETQQDVCPAISLPPTWEEYLQQVGKKQRHEIKRKWEKLFRETSAEFELMEKPAEIRTTIDEFIALHQKSSAEKKSFWDEKHIQFFRTFAVETAEEGWLKLYFLKIDNKRVAAMLGFEYGDQFFLYNSGFDSDDYKQLSVGNVLTAYTIQQAIERKNQKYDFLRGNEEYKFRFGAIAQPIFDLKIERK
jgi:CelD/BcsL family acetyltransferase involved in cellulose biosynthesis